MENKAFLIIWITRIFIDEMKEDRLLSACCWARRSHGFASMREVVRGSWFSFIPYFVGILKGLLGHWIAVQLDSPGSATQDGFIMPLGKHPRRAPCMARAPCACVDCFVYTYNPLSVTVWPGSPWEFWRTLRDFQKGWRLVWAPKEEGRRDGE